MATIKAVNKGGEASPKARIEYVEDELKTSPELMTGINCSSDPEQAIEDMRITKEVWNKTRGRQTLHFVQSFAPGEGTPEEAHAIGVEFAQKNPAWEGYEVFIATHTNRGCLHNHFVINSVSMFFARVKCIYLQNKNVHFCRYILHISADRHREMAALQTIIL